MTSPSSGRRADRAYAALLACLYPTDFRERFADDMRRTFALDHARARAAGWRAIAWFWLGTFFEATSCGTLERVRPRRRPFVFHQPHKGASMTSRLSVDLRDAWRALRATPLVTAVAVLSLALGIGANTALFSIINGLVLRTLPVKQPEQLAVLTDGSWTNPIWEQIRERQTQIAAGAFAWSEEDFDLAKTGASDFVAGAFASGEMFDLLGLRAEHGRLLNTADDVRRGTRDGGVAVISHGLWERRFNGAPDVAGQTITIDRVPFTIVGVLPATFTGLEVGRRCDVVIPIGSEPLIRGAETVLDARSTWWLEIVFRLRPGQTIEQAEAALRAVQPQIREATIPDFPPPMLARYLSGPFQIAPAANGLSSARNQMQQPLVAMLIVVGAVLLIACANIANVLLARATARRRDLSVRLALGASRARIGRQLFCESLLLAGAGVALGLLVARVGSALLVQQMTEGNAASFLDTSFDLRVLGFTAGVGLLTSLAFGLAPAFGVSRVSPNDALKEQGRTIAGDRRLGMRNMLVVAQVALSLILVVGAGLFIRTFQSLSRVPLGLKVDSLLIARLDVKRGAADGDARPALYERLREAAASVPGVRSVALSRIEPLSGAGWNTQVTNLKDGNAGAPGVRLPWVNGVTPGWFDTYGLHVKSGRDFTADDRAGRPRVAVVNEAFARRYFNGANPVGGRVEMGGPRVTESYEVIGLVSDSVYRSPREGSPAIIYVPHAQMERADPNAVMAVDVGAARVADVQRDLARVLSGVDAGVAFTFRPFAERVRSAVMRERLVAILSGAFGALALLLAAVGLYGVTAYGVNRRRTEIGVRMALGANPGEVVRLVVRRTAWLVGIGVTVGAAVSYYAATFLGPALLFGLEPRDPGTFVAAAVVLVLVGVMTAWLPARRASRIDPTTVLRES